MYYMVPMANATWLYSNECTFIVLMKNPEFEPRRLAWHSLCSVFIRTGKQLWN